MILKYTVLHAQLVATQRETVVDGYPATLTITKNVVELLPVDGEGTIKLELPADAQVVPEGTVIDVDFGVLSNG